MNATGARRLFGASIVAICLLSACSSTPADTPSSTESSAGGSVSASPTASGSAAVSATGSATAAAAPTAAATSEPAATAEANPDGTSQSVPAPTTPAEPITPAAATPVPAPGGGDINQTVAPVDVTTQPAVPLTATADYGNGVAINLAAVESVQAQAQLPGEISGPGLKITISIVNGSAQPIDLSNVNVDLQDADGTPAIYMSALPTSPFTGQLAAGQTATGVYVFAVPTTYRDPAAVTVSYSTEAPVVLFAGNTK